MESRIILAGLCGAACMALAGCAISSQTYGPTGKAAYTISCKGSLNTMGNCYEKAGDICGKAGY